MSKHSQEESPMEKPNPQSAPSPGDSQFELGETVGETTPQHAQLKPRHLYMIALGGCVGTAFFVGTGRTLARGGPAFTFVSFVVICTLVWIFSTILIEMSSAIPLHGANIDHYQSRFLSKSFGFAMGWNYWYAYAILVPFEITVATLVISYWNPPVHDAVFITIFLVVIVGLNFLPVATSGEAEFAFSSVKVSLVFGLIILSIVVMAGGGPEGDAIGFKYWHHPAPALPWIKSGSSGLFISFLVTLINTVLPLSFAAEMVATCAGETKNPHKALPRAAKAFCFRMSVTYVVSILFMTALCPADAPELVSGGAGAGSSPFVIGIKTAGIKVLDHIVNAVILCSAWSAGNVYMYLASRSLFSLATAGNAPRIFTKTNRWGVPWVSVAACGMLSLLAYLNVSSSAGVVFNWLVNMINMAAFFSWVVTSLAYLQFRKAIEVQGKDRSSLPYVSVIGKPGAWLVVCFFSVLGLLNGFYVFFPSQWNVSDFMTAYVGTLLFVVLYFGHRFTVGRKDKWLISPAEASLKAEDHSL